MSDLTTEQIQMLAECERGMDDGSIPFVVWGGHRMAVREDGMAEFKLKSGQTVSADIARAITEFQIASLQAQIALARITKGND